MHKFCAQFHMLKCQCYQFNIYRFSVNWQHCNLRKSKLTPTISLNITNVRMYQSTNHNGIHFTNTEIKYTFMNTKKRNVAFQIVFRRLKSEIGFIVKCNRIESRTRRNCPATIPPRFPVYVYFFGATRIMARPPPGSIPCFRNQYTL